MFDYIWSNIESIRIALRRKEVAARVKRGEPVWQEAIDNCNLVLVQDLVSNGEDINSRMKIDYFRHTPLTYALSEYTWRRYKPKYIAMINLLHKLEANFNATSSFINFHDSKPLPHFTPLAYLTYTRPRAFGWTEDVWLAMVALLIDNGANPDGAYNYAIDGRIKLEITPLARAIECKYVSLEKLLRSKNAKSKPIISGSQRKMLIVNGPPCLKPQTQKQPLEVIPEDLPADLPLSTTPHLESAPQSPRFPLA